MGGRRSRMRPRGPIGNRVAPPPETVAAIVAARHERLTAWAIATRLQVPRSTVAAVLVRVGLNRLAAPDTPRPSASGTNARGPANSCISTSSRSLASSASGIAFMAIAAQQSWAPAGSTPMSPSTITAVSPTWRSLPDQRGGTTAAFLRRTVGLVCSSRRDRRAGPDRQWQRLCRRRSSRTSRDRARVRLIRSRPYPPQTNGKAERFIQTLIRGWAYAVAYPSSWRRTLALRPWLRHYNVERPHAALAYQPPCVISTGAGDRRTRGNTRACVTDGVA